MKNPLAIIGILVGVGLTVIAGAAAAQPATFMIVNVGSGLCLDQVAVVWASRSCNNPATATAWPSAG
jgi:hypothetical protein